MEKGVELLLLLFQHSEASRIAHCSWTSNGEANGYMYFQAYGHNKSLKAW